MICGDDLLLGVCLAVISDKEDKEIFEMLYMKYRLILLDDAYNIIKEYPSFKLDDIAFAVEKQ